MDVASLLLISAGAVSLSVVFVVLSMAIAVRPWDADTTRAYKLPLSTSYPVFCIAAWVYALAERIAAMKPAPMRIAELCNSYISSQVLFSIVSLGVPDALLAGPQTAAELARAIGPTTNAEWLDRLLSAAAVMGMLKRTKISPAAAQARAAAAGRLSADPTATAPAAADAGGRDQDAKPHLAAGPKAAPAAQKRSTAAAGSSSSSSSRGGAPVYEYSLNALSAALTAKSPVNMSSFVTMCEDDYVPFAKLAEGIRTGTIPYELHTGGQGFWAWSGDDPTRAARFDLAMVAVNHYGGSAVVNTYPWGCFDCVVDIAGGVGGFMVDVMHRVPGLKQGVVFDLLPKVQLVAGDMFDAATIPVGLL